MKINRIRLNGFKSEERVIDIKFPEQNIAILFGNNGCGKTSFLRIIDAILSQNEEVLLDEKVNDILIEIEDGDQSKPYTIVRRNIDDDSINETKYIWGDFPNVISSILFGVNRGITYNMKVAPMQIEQFLMSEYGRRYKYHLRINVEEFAENLAWYLNRMDSRISNRLVESKRMKSLLYRKNVVIDKIDTSTIEEILIKNYESAKMLMYSRINDAVFNTLSDIVDNRAEDKKKIYDRHPDFKNELLQCKDKLLGALKESTDNSLQKTLIGILMKDNIDEIIAECEQKDIVLILVARMLEEININDVLFTSINMVENIFNAHISQEKKLIIDESKVVIDFPENRDNNHGLSKLSSGERQLLSLLTGCIIIGSEKNIVMIDEPELSLNITWKRKILSVLSEMLPNSQIIVATHSSSVVSRHIDNMVKLD